MLFKNNQNEIVSDTNKASCQSVCHVSVHKFLIQSWGTKGEGTGKPYIIIC